MCCAALGAVVVVLLVVVVVLLVVVVFVGATALLESPDPDDAALDAGAELEPAGADGAGLVTGVLTGVRNDCGAGRAYATAWISTGGCRSAAIAAV